MRINKLRDAKYSFYSHSDDFASTHENMVFQDTIQQSEYVEPLQHQDETFKVHDATDASLASFLARPVLIHTQAWVVGAGISTTIDPWSLFYDNVKVQKKVDGFYLQRFDLKIKLLINGSPFYYGKCLASYNPLGQQDAIDKLASSSSYKIITRSQRNHVVLDACTSIGGEISCPYFHPNAYQEIDKAFTNMGTLSLDTFTNLNNSNGASSTVYIQIYAWADNVVLSVPTTKVHLMTSQADEYSSDVRLAKKSNAKMSADRFMTKTIPKITKYAVATTAFLNAVEGLGLMFGFSRPPVLENQKFVKNLVYGNVANSDAPECVHKLTLDSKQELTIDPRTVGIEPIDELQIMNAISRESFMAKFDWSPASSAGTLIWSARVTPMQVAIQNVSAASTRFTPTLLSYVSQLFEWWTGDIEYSFSVVASNYHKGRLLIVYDPSPPGVATVPDSNSVYSRVVDISEVKDFTIRVAYSQGSPYMRVLTNTECASIIWPTFGGQTYGVGMLTSGIPNEQIGSNGTISVYVLNPLLNPSASDTGIPTVLVKSKACENFRFAGVRNLSEAKIGTVLPNVPIVALQSQSLESPDTVISTKTVSTEQDVDKNPLVWFGETFSSLRPLLKRYNYNISYYPTNSANWDTVATTTLAEVYVWEVDKSNIPQYIGYDAIGFSGTGTNKKFPGRMTTLSYIMPMFVGMRGGIRYKYAFTSFWDSPATVPMTVSRNPDHQVTYESTLNIVSTSGALNPALRNSNAPQISSGASVTRTDVQPVTEIELPYYSNSRFSYIRGYVLNSGQTSIDPSVSVYGKSQGHTISCCLPYQKTASANGSSLARACAIDSYVSVGEDFQLFWLLSAPPTYGVFSGTS